MRSLNAPIVASAGIALDSSDRPGERGHALWSEMLLSRVDAWRHWLLGAVVLAYLAAFNGQWRMEPDSALYLTLARNIATGHGYTYHDRPNAEAYPGLPYTLAGIARLMPTYHRKPENLVPENMLMLAIGLATLGLTYRLFRLNVDRPTAVIVTCGLGLTRTFFRSTFAIMTDMPFLLGVMCVLCGFEGLLRQTATRRTRMLDLSLLGVGLAITVAMRPAWLAFLPVLAVALGVALFKRQLPWKPALLTIGIGVAIATVFLLNDPRRAAGAFRIDRYEDQVLYQFHAGQRAQLLDRARDNVINILEQTASSAMFGVKFGSAMDLPGPRHWYDNVGTVGMVASAIFVLGFGIALFARRGLWGLWICSSLAMMIGVLPHERYFLQVLPLLVLAWWQGICWINRKLHNLPGNLIFLLLLTLGMVPNLLQVGALAIEQRRLPFLAHYHGGRFEDLDDIAHDIRSTNVPGEAMILAPEKTARILTYLSRHKVDEMNDYPFLVASGAGTFNRPIYLVDDPADFDFQCWLASLGLAHPKPVAGSVVAQAGAFRLMRIKPPQNTS